MLVFATILPYPIPRRSPLSPRTCSFQHLSPSAHQQPNNARVRRKRPSPCISDMPVWLAVDANPRKPAQVLQLQGESAVHHATSLYASKRLPSEHGARDLLGRYVNLINIPLGGGAVRQLVCKGGQRGQGGQRRRRHACTNKTSTYEQIIITMEASMHNTVNARVSSRINEG
jgi:hypothetical protein